MGRDLHFEDINHRRVFTDTNLSVALDRVLEKAGTEGLLSGVEKYADTMFNPFQLSHVQAELELVSRRHPELEEDVRALSEMFEKVVRIRGYVWIVGD